jgi:hypothetical protein
MDLAVLIGYVFNCKPDRIDIHQHESSRVLVLVNLKIGRRLNLKLEQGGVNQIRSWSARLLKLCGTSREEKGRTIDRRWEKRRGFSCLEVGVNS